MSEFRRRMMMAAGEKETPNYLRFTALADGTFTLTIQAAHTVENLAWVEYSVNEGETWVHTDNVADTAVTITTPTILAGDSVLWRGSGVRYCDGTNRAYFSATADFNMSGYINSLCFYNDIKSNTTNTYQYRQIFYGNTHIIDASGTILPSGNASNNYQQCFRDCSNLEYAPSFIALRMGTNSYRELFYGCSKLKKVINLATTRASTNAYYQWLQNTPSNLLLVFNIDISDTYAGQWASGKTYILYDTVNDKYYLSDRTTECDENGNPI